MTTARRDDLHPDVETMLAALESDFPELDPSRSAGDDHAERLTAEGDPVVAHRFEGLCHGFLTFPQPSLTGPDRDELWKLIRRRLEVTV
ncbi:alpha/beta hydrolase [Rhodococcus sp. SGAir0479]|uniref:alpha/beta hydrolase n=1 Tax=Rhodococcus sp. SGAir0479 TaxID=2567884 RepID=UPI0010CD1455|nr:alpha/beta hydrolase [Rhodococcus sp. SGAir0479]QCQ93419.1 hypothetical protein E7742_20820 [Rhodococcus sp. SGAir0479]